MHLPKTTLDALDELARADECSPADVVERLVAEEHARRFPVAESELAACLVCGKAVPRSRGTRSTCSARCARKTAGRPVRFVVLDGPRRASAHAREPDANAAAEVLRARHPHSADRVRVVREEL